MSISEYLDALDLSSKNQSDDRDIGPDKPPCCFITISRQAGSGAISIGDKIAEYLNNDEELNWLCPWTVFDKNLVNTILEEHNLPKKIVEYMPEAKTSQISDILGELLGLQPSSLTLIHKTSETILHLAQIGNAIIVGRGASVITRGLKGGFHVRLVGPLKKRVQRVIERSKVPMHQAEEMIAKWDKGRKKYIKDHFNKDDEDPLLYDLIINTDYISFDNTAMIIMLSMLRSQGIE
jgi:cytidylate kinase